MKKQLMIVLLACCAFAGHSYAHGVQMIMVADTNPETAKAVKTSNVSISNFTFEPVKISVPVGAKVVWTNKDDTPHRVRVIETNAQSPALDTDAVFSTTFDKPGLYHYFCTMHPMMKGAIEVAAVK